MWESYLPQACVVLSAIREPSPDMVNAAAEAAKQIGPGDFVGIWRAMVGAAR
jgi:hypothetical protein